MEVTRRELLACLFATPLFSLAGCEGTPPITGSILDRSHEVGHRLRDGWRPHPPDADWTSVDVVIVGGGVAGLSAARTLVQAGHTNLVVLELGEEPGGTSLSGRVNDFACPWGAHYLPVPLADHPELIDFLIEAQIAFGRDASSAPIIPEEALCRDPEERLFINGRWIKGLYPFDDASAVDLAEWDAFQAEIRRWTAWRDADGRKAFAIPTRLCSTSEDVRQLDRLSFAEWFALRGWKSDALRWVLDYCCRDDYGLRLDQTSAWAGLLYFAARMSDHASEAQPLLTWPEGNGFLIGKLSATVGPRIQSGWAVSEIRTRPEDADLIEVTAVQVESNEVRGWKARRVIFAAPQFLAPHLIAGYRDDPVRLSAAKAFAYGSWLVANVALRDRPAANGFPIAWDNVIYDSPALGYVVATHQMDRDFGPTVITWYEPWCDDDPQAARERLLKLTWAEGVERVLSDLESAHPKIRRLVERIDLMRWGHAMIRPVPGFLTNPQRLTAAVPWRGIHFANTDLSGIALFEEAFDQGLRAAHEVIAALSAASALRQ